MLLLFCIMAFFAKLSPTVLLIKKYLFLNSKKKCVRDRMTDAFASAGCVLSNTMDRKKSYSFLLPPAKLINGLPQVYGGD